MKNLPNNGENWTCTDPDTCQYGRKISDNVFEFFQRDIAKRIIDLNNFTEAVIEDAINTFSYTLYEAKNYNINIKEEYGDDANWIIAECIFELEIYPKAP